MALGKALEFPFDRGDRVDHAKYGKGRVQQTLGSSGPEEKILVRFDSGEERIILAGFLSNVSRKDRAKPTSGRHASGAEESDAPAPEPKEKAETDDDAEEAEEGAKEEKEKEKGDAEEGEEEGWQ